LESGRTACSKRRQRYGPQNMETIKREDNARSSKSYFIQ